MFTICITLSYHLFGWFFWIFFCNQGRLIKQKRHTFLKIVESLTIWSEILILKKMLWMVKWKHILSRICSYFRSLSIFDLPLAFTTDSNSGIRDANPSSSHGLTLLLMGFFDLSFVPLLWKSVHLLELHFCYDNWSKIFWLSAQ